MVTPPSDTPSLSPVAEHESADSDYDENCKSSHDQSRDLAPPTDPTHLARALSAMLSCSSVVT